MILNQRIAIINDIIKEYISMKSRNIQQNSESIDFYTV